VYPLDTLNCFPLSAEHAGGVYRPDAWSNIALATASLVCAAAGRAVIVTRNAETIKGFFIISLATPG
jgi:hypothetical protein